MRTDTEFSPEKTPLPVILVIGGTTEGRTACEVLDAAGVPFYYATKTAGQSITSAYAVRLEGGLDSGEMVSFIIENDVGLLIDAAHPFAGLVHRNIGLASEKTGVPVIRFDRFPSAEDSRCRYFDGYEELLDYLRTGKPHRLLSLAGVSSIMKLEEIRQDSELFVRIMERPESLEVVRKAAFPLSNLSYYGDGESDEALFDRIRPELIITKESGESGGFEEKKEAALRAGIGVLVLRRPRLSYTADETVFGPHGLRRAVERLLPAFFELKTGFTTGSCAVACVVAAIRRLLRGETLSTAPFSLPDGEPMDMSLHSVALLSDCCAEASVLKDAGDDADVTHRSEIRAAVCLNDDHPEIRFLKGEGIGTVTLPGLGIPIGEPAINPTPRMMIEREIRKYYPVGGVDVTISVPGGEQLALKTFNPKLGILGGISIVGTSGIIYPFSLDGWKDSIRKEITVARALGMNHLVINSGAKSERHVKALFPDFPPQAFVQYGNFIGETIQMAGDEGFEEVSLALMIGKAVKLAEGHLDTHSHKVVMNRDFLLSLAHRAGCSEETKEAIRSVTMARELWSRIPESDQSFFELVALRCREVCEPLLPGGRVHILLLDDEGRLRYRC